MTFKIQKYFLYFKTLWIDAASSIHWHLSPAKFWYKELILMCPITHVPHLVLCSEYMSHVPLHSHHAMTHCTCALSPMAHLDLCSVKVKQHTWIGTCHMSLYPKYLRNQQCQKDVKLPKWCQMPKNQTAGLLRRFTKNKLT